MLTINKNVEGIAVSANIFGPDGRIVAQMIENKFHINPNNYYRTEQDEHTLVVYDQYARKVLDVRFLNPSSVRVLGIFHCPGQSPITIEESVVKIGNRPYMSMGCLGEATVGLDVDVPEAK